MGGGKERREGGRREGKKRRWEEGRTEEQMGVGKRREVTEGGGNERRAGGRRKGKRKGAVVRNMDGNAKYPILLLISQWEGGGEGEGKGRGWGRGGRIPRDRSRVQPSNLGVSTNRFYFMSKTKLTKLSLCCKIFCSNVCFT